MGFSAQDFLHDFLLPLVGGGAVAVGPPLDADDLAALKADCATASDVTVRIEAARGEVAASTWLYPVQTPVDAETLRLAAGLHNLLFLSHPASQRWSVRDAALGRVIAFCHDCLSLDVPASDGQLVARHTVLRNLEGLTRTDTELRFWAGRRSFTGMEPPPRLLAWSHVRRVEQRQETINWLGTELSDEQRRLVDLVFWQSPLTALLTPLRRFPLFSLATLFPYLGDRRVCRLACQRYLELGLDRVGPVIARDFWRLAGAPSAPFAALSSSQRGWLERACERWIGQPPPGPTAAVTSGGREIVRRETMGATAPLALRLMAALVQYLYATECLLHEPAGDVAPAAPEDAEAGTTLGAVLVAAADCGLLAPIAERQVSERMATVLSQARGALGENAARRSQQLRAALSR